MAVQEPSYYATLEDAINACVDEMQIESREGPLVRRYAFFAYDEDNGWFFHVLIVGEAVNALDRAMWGAGSYAAALNAMAVVRTCGECSTAGDFVSSVFIERRNDTHADQYTFGPTAEMDEHVRVASDFWIVPGGRMETWAFRDHDVTPSAFLADPLKRRRQPRARV